MEFSLGKVVGCEKVVKFDLLFRILNNWWMN